MNEFERLADFLADVTDTFEDEDVERPMTPEEWLDEDQDEDPMDEIESEDDEDEIDDYDDEVEDFDDE